jgi:hypothetical protein
MAGLLLLLVSLWGGELVDGHVHRAPHGGKIAHLGAQHLEMRVDEKQILIWLLDEEMRTLPPNGRALQVTVSPKGRPRQALVLVPIGDHLRAAVDLMGLPELQVSAELKNGRKPLKASFRWTILDATDRIEDSDVLQDLKI